MSAAPTSALSSLSVMRRAIKGAAYVFVSHGMSQVMRLVLNVIIARILLPDDFGLMALMMLMVTGLYMLSDLGTTQSLLQSKRRHDPLFQDTAWSLDFIRAMLVWGIMCALALPLARFYDAPDIALMLPFFAFAPILRDLAPSKVIIEQSELRLGRQTSIELGLMLVNAALTIALALWLRSAWAFVWSTLISAALEMLLYAWLIPGRLNRPRIDRDAARDLIGFGKWIFVSSLAGFALMQADRLLLGKFITLAELGVYNIAFMFASAAVLVGQALSSKLVIPIYRECPPRASRENFLKLRKLRLPLSLFLVLGIQCLGFIAPWLIGTLYEEAYHGAIVVLILLAFSQSIRAMTVSYEHVSIAYGDSRRFAFVTLIQAGLYLVPLAVGLMTYGLVGGLLGLSIGVLLAYGPLVWLARQHGAWDGLHDGVVMAVIILCNGASVWLHRTEIADWLMQDEKGQMLWISLSSF